MRAVIDTGVLVSALIRRHGTTGDVLQALRDGRFIAIFTADILLEIIEVLARPSMRLKYHIESDDISAIINLLRLRGQVVTVTRKISSCRDPKDDKFLEAALAGHVDCVVSGNADLLVLTPFEEIAILRPFEFLARL